MYMAESHIARNADVRIKHDELEIKAKITAI